MLLSACTRGQCDVSEVLLLPFADQRHTLVSVLSGSVLGAEGLGESPQCPTDSWLCRSHSLGGLGIVMQNSFTVALQKQNLTT